MGYLSCLKTFPCFFQKFLQSHRGIRNTKENAPILFEILTFSVMPTARIDISVAAREAQAPTHSTSTWDFSPKLEVPLVSTVCPVENCTEAVPPKMIYSLPECY